MIKIEDIIKSEFAEGRNMRLSASFNKLIKTQEYESERMQADIQFDVLPGEDPLLVLAKAQAILEYECYTQLLFKRQISQNDYSLRKQELEEALNALENKIKAVKDGQ